MGNLRHKVNNALTLFMNGGGNNIPSRHLRMWAYRRLGARIGKSVIFRRNLNSAAL